VCSTYKPRVSAICIALIFALGSPVAAHAQENEQSEYRDNGPLIAEELAERVLEANPGLASAAAAAEAAAELCRGAVHDRIGAAQSKNRVQPANTLARHVTCAGSRRAV